MFGWSIMASAWRSASKRARTCLVSIPALITLSATMREIGTDCSAIQTVPKPPWPMGWRSLYGPMTSPSLSLWLSRDASSPRVVASASPK